MIGTRMSFLLAIELWLSACSSVSLDGLSGTGGGAMPVATGGRPGTATASGGGGGTVVSGGGFASGGTVVSGGGFASGGGGDSGGGFVTGGTIGTGGGDNPAGAGTGGMSTTSGGTCTPGVVGPVITDCGYPVSTSNPLTNVIFNESEVLRAIDSSGGSVATIRVFYNDEHAVTLGVRRVVVKGEGSNTMTDYPVSPLTMSPSSVLDPKTGTNELVGPQSGLDPSLRPMWPALFVTDITADPSNRSGDWQQGGRPVAPNAVFGSWKAAVRTVDTTKTPAAVTITPDADPDKNDWNLAGGDPAPAGLTNQGFGAEVRWTMALTPGHSYRVQAMVHDGDESKVGGDTGEACAIICAGGGGQGGSMDGGVSPPPASCPAGLAACGQGEIDPVSCPAETLCANGCCLPGVL